MGLAEATMRLMARFSVLLVLLGSGFLCRAADPPCAAGAIGRAKQLLAFHAGPDARITVENEVKQLPSMRNPEDPNQEFEVLEVWGYIYKARYRMRLIYFNSRSTACLLMGEEILEFARI
jgi:hypothetical protein